MQRSFECRTTPSSVVIKQFTGHTAWHGASVQCMQAIETDLSPGLPSLMVTTRRRLIPHGTSCSFLQAVTQALHSMQRSASQRNFNRAMSRLLCRSDLTQADLGFLHSSCRIVPVSHYRVRTLTQYKGIGALRIPVTQVNAAEPTAEVERHPGDALADALGDQRLHLGFRAVFGASDPDPAAVLDAALTGVGRIDFYEHILLQLGQPFVGPGFLATAFVLNQATGTHDQRKMLSYALVDCRFLY